MSDYQNLLTSLDERGVQILTINRPAKLNALNHETLGEIQHAVEQAIANSAVRAIIVTGAGEKAFIAGADIAEIQQLTPESSVPFIKRGQMVCDLIQNCPKPIIAAINGFALGGGTEVAMACHIRVASENARFGLPEVGLGIIPGYGGTQRLAQLVGRGRALEYMFTGKQIPAAEAYRIGLANHVVAPSELMPFCQAMLDTMLSKSLTSIANVVTAVNAYFSKPETGYQVEAEAFQKCCATSDFHEGTAAFVEKRKPVFRA